jgi:NAD(P)-dependent dehydrogenase (short-subunit alcohol dehydrogenase family)
LVVDSAVQELGGLDVVVANAGICIAEPWDTTSEEVWSDTIAVNLTGTWNTVMVAAPHLVSRGGGSVILISSAAGLKAQPFMVPYVASKHGVTGMARAFALELAVHKIRVNSIHPAGVDTPMTSGGELITEIRKGLDANPQLTGTMMNTLPIDRLDPIDISNAVLYLASEDSRYVTALAMAVDAGTTRH